jgi:hypothetical protein
MCQSFIQSPQPLPLQNSSDGVSVLVSKLTYQSPFHDMMQNLWFFIKNGRDETDNPLFSIHFFLEDFLTSSQRCHGTNFYIDKLAPSQNMIEICFDLMARFLRQNICTLDDPMVLTRGSKTETTVLVSIFQLFCRTCVGTGCSILRHSLMASAAA